MSKFYASIRISENNGPWSNEEVVFDAVDTPRADTAPECYVLIGKLWPKYEGKILRWDNFVIRHGEKRPANRSERRERTRIGKRVIRKLKKEGKLRA